MAKKNKVLKRISPCSAYDITGTEQWLEEMAAQGFHLCPDNGFMLGIGRFEVGEPKHVKYRLEAASARMALFEVVHWNTDVKPSEEALQIYEEMGWEYVTNRLAFHVYRSVREDVREFNTDPAIQAEGLKSAGIRLLLLVLCLIVSGVELLVRSFFYTFNYGTGPYGGLLSIMVILLAVWVALEVINRCVRFLIYWRKVKNGKNVRSQSKRRRSFVFYRIILLAALWLICCVVSILNAAQATVVSTENYTDPIPFVRLVDAYSGSVEVEEETPRWFSNEVESGSTLLASENLSWSESKQLLLPNGEEISANYGVTYHKARNERIAEMMVKELQEELLEMDYSYEEMSCPEGDVDFVVLYESEIGGPQLIMREGRHVINASIGYAGIADNPGLLDIEQWVVATAEALCEYAELE